MSGTKPVQDNFSGGEVSSRLLGRISHDRYKNGSRRLENCVVTAQGTISKRNGTKAIRAFNVNDDSLDPTFGDGRSEITGVKTIEVVFSREESYAITFLKTTTGVNAYVYSNADADVLEYQTDDNDYKTLDDLVQIDITTIPDAKNTGTITLNTDVWTFKKNSDESFSYLVNAETNDEYRLPIHSSVPAWSGNTDYIFGWYVSNGGNNYVCISYNNQLKNSSFDTELANGRWRIATELENTYIVITRDAHDERWEMVAGAGYATGQFDSNGFHWRYYSDDGDATTIPTTGWLLTGASQGTPQTFGFQKLTLPTDTPIQVGDLFTFDGWTADDIENIDYDIYKNSIIIVTPNHHPLIIKKGTKNNTVAGVDDNRSWTISKFPFRDGPYLESDIGKELPNGANANYSSEDIYITFSKISDVAVLRSSLSSDITGATNLTIGDYVEYRNNGKVLLGKILSFDADIARIWVEPQDPVVDIVDDIDNAAVFESNSSSNNDPGTGMSGVTQIYSDTTVFSKSLEGSYFRHTQIDDDGNYVRVGWFRIDRYLGQRVLSEASDTQGLGTNQNQDRSGNYNSTINLDEQTWDVIDVTNIADAIHYVTSDVSSNTAETVETLTENEYLYLTNRLILYRINSNHSVFDSSRDIGRWIRATINGEKVWGKVLQVNNSTSANVKLFIPPSTTKDGVSQFSTNDWQFGAFYTGNYPSIVSSYEDRIFFSGTPSDPDLFHLSNSEKQTSFGPTDETGEVLDTSAISYRLPSGAGVVKWAISAENLLVGTTVGEYKISPTEQFVSLTPTNIIVRKQTGFGSSTNSAIAVNGSVVFVQAPGKTLRELTYSWENDSYRAINISVVAEHLFSNADPVVELSHITHPTSMIACRTKRGRVIAITYDKENRVVAACPWSISGLKPYSHETGGSGSGSYETTDWAASTTYNIGSTVVYEGMYFQCITRHTSVSDFIIDYTNHYWVHTGAPVVSMCALPAKDDRSADKFIFLTFRSLTLSRSSSYVTPTDHEFICMESIEPFNSALSDSYYANNNSAASYHMDFHLSINDKIDSYISDYILESFGFVSADIKDDPNSTDPSDNNNHLAIIDSKMQNSDRLYGFSLSAFGSELDGTGSPYHTPVNIDNAFASPPDIVLDVLDNLYALHTVSSLPTQLYDINDDSQYQWGGLGYDGKVILAGWSVGFTFPCVITPLPIEFAGDTLQGGGSIGRVKRINEVDILVEDSGTFDFVTDEGRYTANSDNGFQYNGVVNHRLSIGNDSRQEYHIVSFSANRLNILAIATELDINK